MLLICVSNDVCVDIVNIDVAYHPEAWTLMTSNNDSSFTKIPNPIPKLQVIPPPLFQSGDKDVNTVYFYS